MTTTEPIPPTAALARLVSQKRRLLEQLVAIGRRQGELIDAGEIAPLMQLLGGKQQLIAGLRVVEQGLDAFRSEDPESRAWPTPADRAACQADAEACNRMLAEVIATEQRHESLMTQRRDAIGKQLTQTQSAHAATTAYKPHLRAPRPAAAPITPSGTPLSDALDLTTQD